MGAEESDGEVEVEDVDGGGKTTDFPPALALFTGREPSVAMLDDTTAFAPFRLDLRVRVVDV